MKQTENHLWVERNLGGLKGKLKELEKLEAEE